MTKEELTEEQEQALEDEEELEEEEQDDEQPQDKPVEPSQFNKYREAYIKQRLNEAGLKDSVEVESAMDFINERADDTDSNLDEVFSELSQRMRLEQRKSSLYTDPSPGNSLRGRPKTIDGREHGRRAFKRIKEKGMIRK